MSDPITHVVTVVPYYPPHVGGMENVAAAISEALAESADTRVTVVTTDVGAHRLRGREKQGRLEVIRCRACELAHTPWAPGLAWQILRLPRSSVLHVHVAQAFVPEVVAVVAALRRQKFVAHYHLDVAPSGRFGPLFRLYKKFVLGMTLRAAARVIALSPAQLEELRAGHRVPTERIAIVPNGVPSSLLRSPKLDQVTDRPLRLLFVGRLAAQKNVGLLISAVKCAQSEIEVTIVGDGDRRKDLEALARGQENIRFVGAQLSDSVRAWYEWADVFILPSEQEGMPLVLLEAMAAGLPIIATDVPGTRELVRTDGLLVASSPEAMASAVDRLAGDPGLRRALARRASIRAADLTWGRLADRLTAVYREVYP